MPPYFLLPDTEALKKKFWGLRPVNPYCGYVSVENGAKIYAWGSLAMSTFYCVVQTLGLAAYLYILLLTHDLDGINMKLKLSHLNFSLNASESGVESWESSIENAYESHPNFHHVFIPILIVAIILSVSFGYVSWRLKKSIDTKDVPCLKVCFGYMILCYFLSFLGIVLEVLLMWSGRWSMILNVACLIFEIIGLTCTHAFIASVISPGSELQDDMNEIHFGV